MRRRVWTAAQLVFAAAVIWYAADALSGQWGEVGRRLRDTRPQWSYVVTATLVVLFTYAVLIEAWRAVLAEWSAKLRRVDAARVWLASNLGKYVPGKVWSIIAMGALARQQGASGVAAGGAALLMQVVSMATGLAVAAALSSEAVGARWATVALAIGAIALIAFLPRLLAPVFRLVRTLTGRDLAAPPVRARTVSAAALATIVAWVLSGVAFSLLAEALGLTGGSTASYIAVYALSYIAGFVALFAPGGIGVREGALVASMERIGLASAPDAAYLAIASRIWLTVVEVVPGLIALLTARKAVRPATDTQVTTTEL